MDLRSCGTQAQVAWAEAQTQIKIQIKFTSERCQSVGATYAVEVTKAQVASVEIEAIMACQQTLSLLSILICWLPEKRGNVEHGNSQRNDNPASAKKMSVEELIQESVNV